MYCSFHASHPPRSNLQLTRIVEEKSEIDQNNKANIKGPVVKNELKSKEITHRRYGSRSGPPDGQPNKFENSKLNSQIFVPIAHPATTTASTRHHHHQPPPPTTTARRPERTRRVSRHHHPPPNHQLSPALPNDCDASPTTARTTNHHQSSQKIKTCLPPPPSQTIATRLTAARTTNRRVPGLLSTRTTKIVAHLAEGNSLGLGLCANTTEVYSRSTQKEEQDIPELLFVREDAKQDEEDIAWARPKRIGSEGDDPDRDDLIATRT